MEMLVNMMRELSVYYVDEVDADRLMADAAEGMVRRLDPYTVYMPEEEMTDFQFLTTGKYGGVGALIRKKGDGVVIAQPYKGFPADRAGLRIGDRFVEIAGKDARAMTTEQVSALLKGTPNTTVTIKVEKLLTGKVEEVKLRRERIAISGVGYAGFVADGVGYIQHRDFTEGCYEDMRAALERLQRQGLQALVLDYRNNGGGILQEAVKIVSMFVPKGTEVVTTKGRTEHTVYRTQLEPDRADAARRGARQRRHGLGGRDRHRRAAGSGPCGPRGAAHLRQGAGADHAAAGLQQLPEGHHGQILHPLGPLHTGARLLVARREGGRQERARLARAPIRHARRPQGLRRRRHHARRAHRTRVHQPVRYDALCDGLCRRFRRRLLPRTRGADDRSAARSPSPTPDYERFAGFMEDKEVAYESDTRRALNRIKEAAKADLYEESLAAEIGAIEAGIRDDKATNLRTYKREILETLNGAVILRYCYADGVTEHSLAEDRELGRAVALLGDDAEYARILRERDTERK